MEHNTRVETRGATGEEAKHTVLTTRLHSKGLHARLLSGDTRIFGLCTYAPYGASIGRRTRAHVYTKECEKQCEQTRSP